MLVFFRPADWQCTAYTILWLIFMNNKTNGEFLFLRTMAPPTRKKGQNDAIKKLMWQHWKCSILNLCRWCSGVIINKLSLIRQAFRAVIYRAASHFRFGWHNFDFQHLTFSGFCQKKNNCDMTKLRSLALHIFKNTSTPNDNSLLSPIW
jgi:hypothetical protein